MEQVAAVVPTGYICPITNDLMFEPVIDPEGNSYERSAILEWLHSNKVSPITRSPLDASKLVPNRALKEAIELFKVNNPLYGLPTSLVGGQAQVVGVEVDDALRVVTQRNDDYILVSVGANSKVEPTTPCWSDICCVVDVSGSMGSEVQLKSSTGINESFGISQLDLVKHAVKTIIQCLTDKDRLSLVSFSYTGKVIFDLLVMDASGKAFALKKLDELDADGGTNLWDGLLKGLEVMGAASACHRNSTFFLLTDGVASSSPPKGIIPVLKNYISEKLQGNLSCTINTFGFGYDLDSDILQQISYEGNGTYAFIPDGSFVGTIFINAMSNFLTTAAKDVVVCIESVEGSNVLMSPEHSSQWLQAYKVETASWGYRVYVGSVSYGQTKDILIPITLLGTSSAGSALPYARYSLSYVRAIKNQAVEVISVDCHDVSASPTSFYVPHLQRLSIVQLIADCMKARKVSPSDAIEAVNTLLTEWKKQYKLHSAHALPSDGKYLAALLEDVTGQITEALSKDEYYTKWGRHYLPSIAKAHLFQMCNNFKDPGVQFYGKRYPHYIFVLNHY